ncbi:MAG: ABC transporter ATP-binding protein [Notoacmeibacter sp.]|nr:ABC transporter ATP-binding protein [Notoacmeibacter sp.]MCC0031938.1 ABC transporter ATP-binding protein [Brucellaceae bacterium]
MLEVAITEKTYRTAGTGALTAISGMHFSVREGTFSCLVGPSGCGKSTALRIIMGLDDDYQGRVLMPAGRMASVFQEPRLLPWRTVDQNVRLALEPEARACDLSGLYETLGLSGMEHFFPRQLSLGLARRVALARAFAVEPALLLLDEPFVSLDEATAARLRALLMQVWSARPTTALMVTHNIREALELADEIILLTDRPSHVRGVFRVNVPRAGRDGAALERLAAELAAQFPA